MAKTERNKHYKIKEEFFQRDTHVVAKELLGKVLVRIHKNGRIQAGIIVEDEAYHGFEDRASHASRKMTERNKVMFGPGGFYYVYFIYGMYWNLNIVSGEAEFPSAILIRALEPVYDSKIGLGELTLREKKIMASGPGRLCRWMEIDKFYYGKSVENEELFVIEAGNLPSIVRESEASRELKKLVSSHVSSNNKIVTDKRVGVSYAAESADWDWRYYLKDNDFVSK